MEKLNPHYVRGGTLPRKIKSGYVLCHNHVMHTLAMPSGVNGFRAVIYSRRTADRFYQMPVRLVRVASLRLPRSREGDKGEMRDLVPNRSEELGLHTRAGANV